MKLQGSKDRTAVVEGMQSANTKLQHAADATKTPGAAAAIRQLADDVMLIMADAQQGKRPGSDTSKALTDAQKVSDICGGKG